MTPSNSRRQGILDCYAEAFADDTNLTNLAAEPSPWEYRLVSGESKKENVRYNGNLTLVVDMFSHNLQLWNIV